MTEQLHGVLAQFVLVVISGQPALSSLFVVVDLNHVFFEAWHRHDMTSWFLQGYARTKDEQVSMEEEEEQVTTDLELGKQVKVRVRVRVCLPFQPKQ